MQVFRRPTICILPSSTLNTVCYPHTVSQHAPEHDMHMNALPFQVIWTSLAKNSWLIRMTLSTGHTVQAGCAETGMHALTGACGHSRLAVGLCVELHVLLRPATYTDAVLCWLWDRSTYHTGPVRPSLMHLISPPCQLFVVNCVILLLHSLSSHLLAQIW